MKGRDGKMMTDILANQMEMNVGNVASVVIGGFLVTFVCLIILIIFIKIMGAIFNKASKDKQSGAGSASAPKANITKAVMSEPGAAALASNAIPGEIVAAISAAIAMIGESTGKTLRVKSITAKGSSRLNGVWSKAGRYDNTRPF